MRYKQRFVKHFYIRAWLLDHCPNIEKSMFASLKLKDFVRWGPGISAILVVSVLTHPPAEYTHMVEPKQDQQKNFPANLQNFRWKCVFVGFVCLFFGVSFRVVYYVATETEVGWYYNKSLENVVLTWD